MLITKYPEKCRPSIKKIAKVLHVDYETAYGMMVIEACQYDMHPHDQAVADMIIQDILQYKK